MWYKNVEWNASYSYILKGDSLMLEWEVPWIYVFDNFRYIYGISRNRYMYIYDMETNKCEKFYLGKPGITGISWYELIQGIFYFVIEDNLYIATNNIIYSYKAPHEIKFIIGDIYKGIFLGCFCHSVVFVMGNKTVHYERMAYETICQEDTKLVGIFDLSSARNRIYTIYTLMGEKVISIPIQNYDGIEEIITLCNNHRVNLLLEEI